MQCEYVKIERMHKKLPASQLHRNELTSAPTTRAVAKGMEKRHRLRDLGAQELFLPCLFHMQCRFEAA